MNQRLERRLHREVARVPHRRITLVMSAADGLAQATVSLPGIGEVVVAYPQDYPFRPPTVRVNHMSYARFLEVRSPRFQQMYSDMFQGRCCCVCHCSLTSKENWSPAHQLHNILEEIEQFHHDKCLVGYSLLVERIKERHGLPEDLPILSFL